MKRLRLPILLFFIWSIPDVLWSQSLEKLSIEWAAPEGCGSKTALMGSLKHMLGDTWSGDTAFSYKTEIAAVKGRWAATLVADSDRKRYTRTIRVNTCEAATEVLALLVGLSLDPVRVMSSEDPDVISGIEALESAAAGTPAPENNLSASSGETPGETPVDEAALLDDVEPAPEPTETQPNITEEDKTESEKPDSPNTSQNISVTADAKITGDAGVLFTSYFGWVAAFEPGIAIAGNLQYRFFIASVSVHYLPPVNVDVSNHNTATYHPQMGGGTIGLGGAIHFGKFQISPIVGIDLNRLFVESRGIENPESKAAWLLSGWGAVSIKWTFFWRFAIAVIPKLHVLLWRPRIQISGVGTVFQPKRVAGAADFGFLVVF